MVATRCHILRPKCTKFDSDWDSAPDPARELAPLPHSRWLDITGPTSKGRLKEEKQANGCREVREGRGSEYHWLWMDGRCCCHATVKSSFTNKVWGTTPRHSVSEPLRNRATSFTAYGAGTIETKLKRNDFRFESTKMFYFGRCTIHEIKHWNVSATGAVHVQNCMTEAAKNVSLLFQRFCVGALFRGLKLTTALFQLCRRH